MGEGEGGGRWAGLRRPLTLLQSGKFCCLVGLKSGDVWCEVGSSPRTNAAGMDVMGLLRHWWARGRTGERETSELWKKTPRQEEETFTCDVLVAAMRP